MKKKVFLSFAALTAAFTMNAQSKLPRFNEPVEISNPQDIVLPAKTRSVSATDHYSAYYKANHDKHADEINALLTAKGGLQVQIDAAGNKGPLVLSKNSLRSYEVKERTYGAGIPETGQLYWNKVAQGLPITSPVSFSKIGFYAQATNGGTSNILVSVYDKTFTNLLADDTLSVSTFGYKTASFESPVLTSDSVLVVFEMLAANNQFGLGYTYSYFKSLPKFDLSAFYTGTPNANFNYTGTVPFAGDGLIFSGTPNTAGANGTSIKYLLREKFDFFVYPYFNYDLNAPFTASKTDICAGESVVFSTPSNSLIKNPLFNFMEWNKLVNGVEPAYTYITTSKGDTIFENQFSKSITFPTNGTYTVKAKGIMAPWSTADFLEDSTMITINVGPQLSGANAVCLGSTTTLTPSVAGGTWLVSTGGGFASVLNGVVTGKAAGTATIRYTKTGTCAGVVNKVITVNSKPSAGALGGALTSTGKFAVCPTTTRANTATVAGGTWSIANNAIATVDANGLVTGVAAGSTTLSYTVTNANGCSNTASRLVIVDSKPTTPVIYGTNLFMCLNGKAYLTASLPNGKWSAIDSYLKFSTLNNGMFFQQNTVPTDNFVSGVKYTLSSTNNACTSEATKEIKIRKLAQKAVTISATSTNLVVNQQVTATATTTMTAAGAWRSFLPASLSATVSPTNNKQATIKGLAVGTNGNIMFQAKDAATGCNNGGWLAFNVTATQSIVDANPTTVSTTTGVSVYPNPSKGVVTFENIAGANAISLVDMTGRTIKTVAVNADRMTVDFSGVQNGKYLVQVAGENVNEVRSIVIE